MRPRINYAVGVRLMRNVAVVFAAVYNGRIFPSCRSLEFLNDQHQGDDRVRLGRSYNSDDDNESNEVGVQVFSSRPCCTFMYRT